MTRISKILQDVRSLLRDTDGKRYSDAFLYAILNTVLSELCKSTSIYKKYGFQILEDGINNYSLPEDLINIKRIDLYDAESEEFCELNIMTYSEFIQLHSINRSSIDVSRVNTILLGEEGIQAYRVYPDYNSENEDSNNEVDSPFGVVISVEASERAFPAPLSQENFGALTDVGNKDYLRIHYTALHEEIEGEEGDLHFPKYLDKAVLYGVLSKALFQDGRESNMNLAIYYEKYYKNEVGSVLNSIRSMNNVKRHKVLYNGHS